MKNSKLYLNAMAAYWLVFGLITTFYPKLMDLFQTPAGVAAKSDFSNNIWFHEGLDIISVCILLFVAARAAVGAGFLRAVAVVALMPAIAIFYSYFTTPFWAPFFLVPGFGCIAFAVWGAVLASKLKKSES